MSLTKLMDLIDDIQLPVNFRKWKAQFVFILCPPWNHSPTWHVIKVIECMFFWEYIMREIHDNKYAAKLRHIYEIVRQCNGYSIISAEKPLFQQAVIMITQMCTRGHKKCWTIYLQFSGVQSIFLTVYIGAGQKKTLIIQNLQEFSIASFGLLLLTWMLFCSFRRLVNWQISLSSFPVWREILKK